MPRKTERITSVDELLKRMFISGWDSKYAAILKSLGGPNTPELIEHFDDGQGHSGALTQNSTDVAAEVFKTASDLHLIKGKPELGYTSKYEFVLSEINRTAAVRRTP